MPPEKDNGIKKINGELYYYDEFLDDYVPMGIRVVDLVTEEEVAYEVLDEVFY